jgi:uncharacterized protein YcbK (DUF882 family)
MTEYFSTVEFQCKCGRAECDALKTPHPALVLKLNVMRMTLNRPLTINSGIRCKYWNTKSGGTGTQHIDAEAADIRVSGSRERYQVAEAAYKAGFKRIGIAKTFVHVDVGKDADQEVLWLY